MGWRNLLGNALMKVTDALPVPAEPPAPDALNYLLAQQLQPGGANKVTLARQAQAAFPAVTAAEATALLTQLDTAHEAAFDLASQVNQQRLTADEATAALKQQFPQLTPGSISRLLTRNLVDTR
jgi:hypothetical protein